MILWGRNKAYKCDKGFSVGISSDRAYIFITIGTFSYYYLGWWKSNG